MTSFVCFRQAFLFITLLLNVPYSDRRNLASDVDRPISKSKD